MTPELLDRYAQETGAARGPLAEVLQLCAGLGQLLTHGEQFVAWLRCELEHVPLFVRGDMEEIRGLSVRELQEGAVLVVAELRVIDGRALRVARQLGRLPGVRWLAARRGRRFPIRRVRMH